MRKVITVAAKPFDPATITRDVQAIVDAFDHYLDDYPVKAARSKHSVMGPVAYILDHAKAGGYTRGALVGYAMRMHEMSSTRRIYPSQDAQKKLEEGTERLLKLCTEVPTTALSRLIEQIDYSLYYVRRKKAIEFLEHTREEFKKFVRSRYSTDDELRRSWAKSKDSKRLTLEKVAFPSRRSEDYKTDARRKQDTDDFWETLGDGDGVVEESDEEGVVQ